MVVNNPILFLSPSKVEWSVRNNPFFSPALFKGKGGCEADGKGLIVVSFLTTGEESLIGQLQKHLHAKKFSQFQQTGMGQMEKRSFS